MVCGCLLVVCGHLLVVCNHLYTVTCTEEATQMAAKCLQKTNNIYIDNICIDIYISIYVSYIYIYKYMIHIYLYLPLYLSLCIYICYICFEHSGDISCSLLVNSSHTDESWAGRNTCLWVYIYRYIHIYIYINKYIIYIYM